MSKYVIKAEIEFDVEAATPDGAYRKFVERMVTDFNVDQDMNSPTIKLKRYRGLDVKLVEVQQDSPLGEQLKPSLREAIQKGDAFNG